MPPHIPRLPSVGSALFRLLPLLLALCAGAASARPAAAQEMAVLEGRVTEPSGAPVASAIVEVRLEGGSFRRGTTTDAAGRYRVAGLPPGRYRVQARHPGYATLEAAATAVRGETAARDLVLQPRALVIDTVTVTSQNPASIRRDDTEFRTEVSETAIELLPLRPSVGEIVALTPGARAQQVWGGSTEQANNYQIDGLSANHPGLGGELIAPSLLWIESVEVRGLGAAAELGNFQGGLVNVVTKRGTNRFEGSARVGIEAGALSATNLQQYDVASETNSRYDVEAEARGPILRDRLFYYVAGQLVRRDDRVVNHLLTREGFFAPDPILTSERKAFGKLSWQPGGAREVTLAGGFTDARVDRYGANGFEDGAFTQASAPTFFFSGTWRQVLGEGRVWEVNAGGFTRDERRDPFGGPGTPGVLLFGQGERPAYNAPAFRQRLAPSSATLGTSLAWQLRAGRVTHQLKAGAELTGGRWIYEQLRNGEMTWRPGFGRFYDTFDPQDTRTWARNGFVPVAFGGEVRLDTDVRNGAVYLQDHVDIGSRISISPGVRLGWWSGSLTPADGVAPRFEAVSDRAVDPRLGVTLDLTGGNDLVLKGHWGRYHQSLFAQFYDRVEGGNVFQNEQLWYFFGRPDAPGRTFTAAERDAMANAGTLQMREEVRLNQTGPVDGYRQPYVDQLVLGAEKQMGRWWKAELVYVNRRNENMMALVDRNLATNWTAFDSIAVLDVAGDPVMFNGQPVVLPRLYLPNFMVVDHLKQIARGYGFPFPPGMVPGDTISLQWDPDYVLTHAPDARRTLHQVQLVLRMGHPRHGGTISLVHSLLRGNLDNVSGYTESVRFAGPYVNPNQGINGYGRLPNSSAWELKTWIYGTLRWGFRGGLFWSQARGDRYTPTFNVSSFYQYATLQEDPVDQRMVVPVTGQPLLLLERGSQETPYRSIVDLHLERAVRGRGAEWLLSVDAFNVLGTDTPTRRNTIVNGALAPGSPLGGGIDPELVYGAVRERVRPRSLRFGATVRF